MNSQNYDDEEVAQILLNLPCSIWWIDKNHKYIGCNLECCGLFGLAPKEFLGKDMLQFGVTREHFKPLARKIYDEETMLMETGIAQFQAMYAYGAFIEEQKVRQLCAKIPLFNLARTQILGMLGAGILEHEYNDQLKMELAKLSPDQFIFHNHPTINFSWSEMLHMLPASIWWIDREHKYRGANLAYCHLVKKLSGIELMGKTIFDVGKANQWSEVKIKNMYDLDESLMMTNTVGYNVENIWSAPSKAPPIRQIIAKKPILDERGKVKGLMCVAVYNGLFGEKSQW